MTRVPAHGKWKYALLKFFISYRFKFLSLKQYNRTSKKLGNETCFPEGALITTAAHTLLMYLFTTYIAVVPPLAAQIFLRNFIHILLGLIIIFLESLSVLGKDHNGVCCCLKRRQVKLHTTDWLGQSGITCAVICILRACSRGASSPELISTEVLLCLAGCLFGLQLPVEFIPCDTR